jgi:hypothetical protein
MQSLKVVSLYLIALSLNLISCAHFPELHPFVLSLKNNKCGEYEVVKQSDACDIQYKFKAWHPLEDCEGYFSLPPSDVEALLNYQTHMCNSK